MKPKWISCGLISLSLVCSSFAIDPTAQREWTSKTGTKLTAIAVDLNDRDFVILETADDRTIKLKLQKLSDDDQVLLLAHFRGDIEDMKDEAPAGAKGFVVEPGSVEGPLKADDDTSYYLYVPDSYQKSIRSAVMIWTQSDGGRAESLTHLRGAADLTGMIIATPVEARNEGESTLINNLSHANDVLRTVKSNLSINSDAVYFGGNDSGAAAAFWNSSKIKSSGTFTVSGFFTPDMTGNNSGYHFMSGGSTDYNRYLTAWAAAKFGDSGTHYLYAGGREFPDRDTTTTGVIWMYAQSLYGDIASRTDEASAFEERFLPWIENLADVSEGEALFLTDVLTNHCTLRGDFKSRIETLNSDLSQSEAAMAHLEGRKDLAEFSRKQYADFGNHFSPLKAHAPKKFVRMAEKLAEKYAKAERLEKVFEQIAKPTVR